MRRNIFVIMAAALLTMAMGGLSQIILDKEVESRIAEILQQPAQVYGLDSVEGARIFKHMDDWVNNYLSLSKAKRSEFQKRGLSGFRARMKKNLPISVSGEEIKGVQPKRAFDMFYIQDSLKCRFVKDLTVPTKQKLSPEEVERMGRDFIKRTGFCRQTEFDRIGRAEVISHMRRRIEERGTLGEELTISQDAVFKRVFRGMEVFNSKQIVGIHPDSREIIAYRLLNWTPVDEQSGKEMTYETLDKVLERIKRAFEKSPYMYKVTGISPGMYQADGMIFPAIRIKVEPQLEQGEPKPIGRILIVGLVKGLKVGEEPKRPARWPKEPKVKEKIDKKVGKSDSALLYLQDQMSES